MIRKFLEFNESKNAFNFFETEEYKKIVDKYAVDKSKIDDFFLPLKDENDITYTYRTFVKSYSNMLKITLFLTFNINYINQKGDPGSNTARANHLDMGKYQEFLNKQLSDISEINKYCINFSKSEDFIIQRGDISKIPFQGAGNNTRTEDELNLFFEFTNIVKTDEMDKAKIEFENSNNPFKKILNKVIDHINDMGVPKKHGKNLIETEPDWQTHDGLIMIGFSTNNQIRLIANLDRYDMSIEFDDKECSLSVESYLDGECSDILGENYLDDED